MSAGSTTWTLGPDIPHTVYYGSCSVATSPTTIVITGGAWSPAGVFLLDVVTGAWSTLPDLPRGREGHGCAVVANKFLVVTGGYFWDLYLD